ncbi:MHYT domain-containing protein [Methylobacterium iners]|uniref:histidine kinase n=1 Tax=Methylobacterium iners TaxID=418707 RepID=A0ABQ4RUM5_9HYPH|nr:MHYT domain-containing protein [Methylobacterium iners]GJD93907.1 Sensor histidine kinase RcsC [Methylobacterium iners]
MSLTGAHDSTLVALSILIATVASYTALDLAGRIRAATGWAARAWLATAALAMGGGIWAMHFVAMLAFSMPGMEAHYDLGLTLLSLIVPVAVTGIGFAVVNRPTSSRFALAASGLLMGIGIAAMHYTGMAAMHVPASLRYDAPWVAVSILIAVGASTIALWLAFKNTGLVQKLVAAGVMGMAVSGMHYTAMYAASFTAHGVTDGGHGYASIGQTNLALAVAATTFLILFLSLIAAMFDRRFAVLAEREALALRRSEEQFRALYRKTPLPLHALDAEGRVEEVSEAWLDLLGYPRESVVGRPLINFMSGESARRRVQEDWPKLLASGALRDAEYRFVTHRGEPLDVLLSSQVERDAQGRFLRALGGLVDVTARRRAEEALRQAQKMEAVGRLTGGIAHDFNNLLAVVIGNLDLLRKRLPDDPRLTRLVEHAIQGAERGASLTQRMLSFARRQSLRPERICAPDLVRGMEDLLRRSIGPQVQIETHFPLGLAYAYADANQVELALLNLVVNARDAMPNGGIITISAREQAVGTDQVSGLSPGKYVCLAVSDTGTGMDEATLGRAMEPFFTTKGVGKGTGLGLSMVHGLAEQSGGALVLESRVGVGTTAEVWLPFAEAREEPGEIAAEAGKKAGAATPSLTVLAIDDDALVLANTAAMLDDLGHVVLEASSGEEALTFLRRGRKVDLIITDYAMPGMTGLHLAEAIRAEWPRMPILLATGYAEVALDSHLALPRLNKPYQQADLADAVAGCLKQEDAADRVVAFRPVRGG